MPCEADPAPVSLEVFAALEAVPPACDALFDAQTRFQDCRAWYRTVIRHALPAGAEIRLVVCRRAGRPIAMFPMQMLPGRTLASLTTPYTTLYTPLIAATAGPDDVRQAGIALGRFCRGAGTTRIDALDPAWPHLPHLAAGFRRAGLAVLRFDHFGNWHTAVEGLAWSAYLAARPGALRETIRRRLRRAERDTRLSFELAVTPASVTAAITAYEAVSQRSWQGAEPFPSFNPALMQAAAACGVLRVGVLRHDGHPVAAQYWIVDAGGATVMKLAHDAAFASHSPGTLLTAMMIRGLLDHEHVAELDFGRGDDAYKRSWAERRRQRIGIVLVDPLRAGGLITVGRHLLGRGLRAMRRHVPDPDGQAMSRL